MPSTVTTERPATALTGNKQLTTGLPSSSTVQAPHTPSPQTSLVPVNYNPSRRASTSSVWLSAAIEQKTPLTVKLTIMTESGRYLAKQAKPIEVSAVPRFTLSVMK